MSTLRKLRSGRWRVPSRQEGVLQRSNADVQHGSRLPHEPHSVPASGECESSEAGYILLAVIFMTALVVLSLAIAAPKVAAAIQRDREVEMVHRGEQYKRAIRLYYKKFGSYPNSIDQLEKTNNIRFLRQRYLDPLTGKDDWKLIHMGQAHVRPLGFFGQTLGVGGTSLAGASTVSNGSFVGAGGSSQSGASSTSPFSSSSGSSFGSGGSFGGGSGSSSVQGSTGVGSTGSGGGLYAPSNTDDGSGTNSTAGSGSNTGSSLGAGATTSTTLGGGNTNTAGFGTSTSTTLGGAPVVGVMPPMTKATILQYKLKTHTNEWEFVYDPVEEQTAAASIVGGSGSVNGGGNSVNGPGSSGTGSGFGSTPGTGTSSSTFGSGMSGSSGSTGSQPTTTPQ